MKFYQNKTTGQIIGVQSMNELIKHPTEESTTLGYKGYSWQVIYQVIHPNKILGNGIESFFITYAYLKEYYKRICKEIAYEKYPVFEQYRYKHIPQGTSQERLKVLHDQTW